MIKLGDKDAIKTAIVNVIAKKMIKRDMEDI